MAGDPPRGGAPAGDDMPLRGSTEPLASRYDVALLDLDGVVYLGGAPIPGAAEALAKATASGMRLAFVTNNASRTPSAIAAQLTGLGVPARAGEVITSAQAAARLLAERLLAVAAGALFVASNADSTLPTPRGRQPGNGSLIQVIATATGRAPLIAGKPEPPLHAEAVARTGARRPLVVGDRLDTDIESAVRSGADSLLVLTGVTRPADAVLASARHRPTYLAEGLAGLLGPHPQVTGAAGACRCAGWRATATGGEVALSGTGAAIDGLRALCAAAWSAGGVSPEAAVNALAGLGLPHPPG